MKEKKKNVNETNRRRTHSVLYTDWYAKQRRSESGVRSNFTRGEKKPNANTHTYEFSQWKVSVIVRFFFSNASNYRVALFENFYEVNVHLFLYEQKKKKK